MLRAVALAVLILPLAAAATEAQELTSEIATLQRDRQVVVWLASHPELQKEIAGREEERAKAVEQAANARARARVARSAAEALELERLARQYDEEAVGALRELAAAYRRAKEEARDAAPTDESGNPRSGLTPDSVRPNPSR